MCRSRAVLELRQPRAGKTAKHMLLFLRRKYRISLIHDKCSAIIIRRLRDSRQPRGTHSVEYGRSVQHPSHGSGTDLPSGDVVRFPPTRRPPPSLPTLFGGIEERSNTSSVETTSILVSPSNFQPCSIFPKWFRQPILQ